MTGAAVASRWTVAPLTGAVALEETEWNALARRGFHQYQWFRAAEDSGWLPRHVLVRRDGVWYARTADEGITAAIPPALLQAVEQGRPAMQRVRAAG